MLYNKSEIAWINRRAELISEGGHWPLPIARSEACAELVRMRQQPVCGVVVLALAAVRYNERFSNGGMTLCSIGG